MSEPVSYRSTRMACYRGYIVQGVVNNLSPLFFVIFQKEFGISYAMISSLILFNFVTQICVDVLCVRFVDRTGYRAATVFAHICCTAGLVLLGVLPRILPAPFLGLAIATIITAVGGGIIEVAVSPIIDSLPSEAKDAKMSLLHSFYCWGHVGVVLVSTAFFRLFGIGNWKILAVIWSLIPIINCLVFLKAPIAPLIEDGEKGMRFGELFREKIFWVLMLMMFCSGASEQAVSQWASTFAEKGLGVTKTVGDLAGPLAFAFFMGSSRAYYGRRGDRIDLDKFMLGSCLLCIASYLLISLCPNPAVSLIGCALCGLSVGIMWPGTFSKASASLARGGTALFAFLALAGDLGCSGGPTVVGFVSSACSDNLKAGILVGVCFPILLAASLIACKKIRGAS